MADIRAMPQGTQSTRHDCVEGWSAIGRWTGVQLHRILEAAGVKDGARYIVFRCADRIGDALYYESCDMIDAHHPQTIMSQLRSEEQTSELQSLMRISYAVFCLQKKI